MRLAFETPARRSGASLVRLRQNRCEADDVVNRIAIDTFGQDEF